MLGSIVPNSNSNEMHQSSGDSGKLTPGPGSLPIITYKQVGLFLQNFVRACTSYEWHFDKSFLCKANDSSIREEIKNHRKSKMPFLLTSRERDHYLCMNVFNYDFIGAEDLNLTEETKAEFIPKITKEDHEMERKIQVCEPCCKVLTGFMALEYHRDSIGHMDKMKQVEKQL